MQPSLLSASVRVLLLAAAAFGVSPVGAATGPPTADSVTPSTGAGTSQSFTFKYSSPNGFGYLSDVYALFNLAVTGMNGCMVMYDEAGNSFYLYNDAASFLIGPVAPGGPGSISNSQCVLSGAGSSVAGAGNTLTMVLNLSFTFYGTKAIYMYAADSGGQNSGWQYNGYWSIPFPQTPPTADSVTPSSGTGSSQSFTFKYSSPAGYMQLYLAEALFVNGAGNCHVQYYSSMGGNTLLGLFLIDDNGSRLGPLSPGGTVSNSACTLTGTGSSATGSGNTLSIILNLSFKSTFQGAKAVYLNVWGYGLTSGWQQRGTWMIPAVQSPPTVGPAIPNSGNNSSQAFSFTYSSPNGYSFLADTYVLINTSIDATSACVVVYDQPTNSFYLYNDSATALLGPLAPNTNGTLSNSQCTLHGPLWTALVTGYVNTINVQLYLNFKAPFHGAKTIFTYASDAGGLNSGWQNSGTWTVPTLPNTPTADSVAPSSGNGGTQSFAFAYSSANGSGYLSDVYALFNTSLTGAGGCLVLYDRATNGFYLYNDAGAAISGPLTPGSGVALSNGQCTLNGTGSSVSSSGNTLVMTVNLTFSNSFAAAQTTYMFAADYGGLISGWQIRGNWTVPVH